MTQNLTSAWLGLGASTAWGGGDFCGGYASRRSNVFGVVAVGYSAGMLLLAAAALITGAPAPPLASLVWTVPAGVCGGLALSAFYHGMSTGRMGVVAPVSAVLTAAVPLVFGFFTQGAPTLVQCSGFGLALVGIWLVSRPSPEQQGHSGILMAILAGIGFGFYLVLIGKACRWGVLWPLVIARGVSVLTVILASAPLGKFRLPLRPTLGISLAAGCMDGGGIALFALASRIGRLDVAAVLSSLYPAITVILARLILKEHMNVSQRWGMVTAVAAIVLITL